MDDWSPPATRNPPYGVHAPRPPWWSTLCPVWPEKFGWTPPSPSFCTDTGGRPSNSFCYSNTGSQASPGGPCRYEGGAYFTSSQVAAVFTTITIVAEGFRYLLLFFYVYLCQRCVKLHKVSLLSKPVNSSVGQTFTHCFDGANWRVGSSNLCSNCPHAELYPGKAMDPLRPQWGW